MTIKTKTKRPLAIGDRVRVKGRVNRWCGYGAIGEITAHYSPWMVDVQFAIIPGHALPHGALIWNDELVRVAKHTPLTTCQPDSRCRTWHKDLVRG